MKIFASDSVSELTRPSHPVFKFVEKRFWNWLAAAPAEVKEMYESDDAIYDKKGAIQDAITSALEEANETLCPVDLLKFDLECAFE